MTLSISKTRQKFIDSAKFLGDAWVLIIIQVLVNGPLRFSEIERQACGVCPVTLTDRLKKLEQEGVIKRFSPATNKVSVMYELTAKGQDILPLVAELEKFARKY